MYIFSLRILARYSANRLLCAPLLVTRQGFMLMDVFAIIVGVMERASERRSFPFVK